MCWIFQKSPIVRCTAATSLFYADEKRSRSSWYRQADFFQRRTIHAMFFDARAEESSCNVLSSLNRWFNFCCMFLIKREKQSEFRRYQMYQRNGLIASGWK